ncbi:MAG: hypothetical protein HYY40_06820 [Bacteroidetes bacterium]|nr:hypothetical protein [Bacteroidota bacterium]
MKTLLPLFILLLVLTGWYCKPKAGSGGKAKLSVHFYEKDKDPVFEGIIYIKYNATTFPGTDPSVYDEFQVTDYGAKVIFENLRQGEYYLYGIKVQDTVEGGTYYKIDNRIGEREVVIHEDKYCDLGTDCSE